MKNKIYENLFDFKLKENLRISSSNNEIYNQLLLYIFSRSKKNMLILTSNLTETNKLFFILKKYYENTFLFPEDEYLTKKSIASSPDLLYMRLKLLNSISNDERKIVICHLNSFIKKLPNIKKFRNLNIKLSKSTYFDRNILVKRLVEIGYKKESVVSNTGDFSVRGFILDVFPIDEPHPIRIEFFDNQIETIKYFDEFTQLSISELNDISICPISDEYNESSSSIIDYLDNPVFIVQDEKKINQSLKTLNEQQKYYGENVLSKINYNNYKNKVYIDLLDNYGNYDMSFSSETIQNYDEKIEIFSNDIIKNNGVLYSINDNLNNILKNKVPIKNEYLNRGFIFDNSYYYSCNDLQSQVEMINYNIKYSVGKRISNVDNIKVGDYIVHKSHGIGVYMGIKTITKNKIKKDYILLHYKGNDKLYIPVDSIDKLYKYSSKDGSKPKLQNLNSDEWNKIKSKVRKKIKDISAELIKLYKERTSSIVEPYDKDSEMQEQFESEFPFEPTADQLKAASDIKKDLELSKPMDRLLCGDVGYGKTEVIFRAIFKTVLNNKQVFYLCPTTLLSQQQYENAVERFKNYGVNIEILNRYTSPKKIKEILDNLKDGKIDVLFGTHRLLSEDVKPFDLGLLVIDEEQRFGVSHKEKIKKYKTNVHVLSVSATPIPRSLQMSLTGIRDLSLIETPPVNRYPVQTYVIAYDELLLKEAIQKELSRKGQVFILYNKIKNMDAILKKYREIMPEASFRYAHGKMPKETIQDIMCQFRENKFDVLISTTIIENGIDIPNVNTMIIIDSNLFGLSQLYQIRGRVGRSNKIAYAYLMYNKSSVLTEEAVKRLNAIKEFTQLGSGYKISMRDLSIRGAGDLLGSEQAGFIDSVGVDLYLQLINEELNNIPEEPEQKNINIDDVETHINEIYTEEDELLIELHEKINSISSQTEYDKLKSEIIDRYGLIDEKIEIYMIQEFVKNLLKKLGICLFTNDPHKISLKLDDKLFIKLNIEDLFVTATKICTKFSFVYKNNFILISIPKQNQERNYLEYILELLKYINKNIENI